MTNEEKTSLKAACLQAATTLIAARDSVKGAVDVDECVKLAAELYCRVTAMNWRQEGRQMKSFTPATLVEVDRNAIGKCRETRTSGAEIAVNAAFREASYARAGGALRCR
jgi:hypothetical protein